MPHQHPPPASGCATSPCPQHAKIALFQAVLGLAGLAALFRAAAMPGVGGAAGLAVSQSAADVLAIIAVVAYCLLALP